MYAVIIFTAIVSIEGWIWGVNNVNFSGKQSFYTLSKFEVMSSDLNTSDRNSTDHLQIEDHKTSIETIIRDNKTKAVTIENLKRTFANSRKMTREFLKMASTYLDDKNQSYFKYLNGSGKPSFHTLSKFGVTLLESYAANRNLTDHLQIVEHIIIKTNDILKPLNIKYYNRQTPWNSNWYNWSVSFTRMMTMYEYLGDKEDVKKICHELINQIIPELNKSFGWEREGINFIYLAIPRLLSNYLIDDEKFDFDTKSNLFKELYSVFNVKLIEDNVVRNGIYSDYSVIYHRNVATYSYLLTVGGFYCDSFKALGFKADIDEFIARNILPKLLHPDLPYITFGLFGRTGSITCHDMLKKFWFNYDQKTSNYGVDIMPIIGVGIIRTKRFMFSLRIQRPNITAYESDPTHGEYALGWVQLRKLYLTDVYKMDKTTYGFHTNWYKLTNQPGVISIKNSSVVQLSLGFTIKHYTTVVILSHIGRLVHDNVLFWFQKYKFPVIYGDDTTISETGICTENGLTMSYFIENNGNKTLKFTVRDSDNKNHMNFKCYIHSESSRYSDCSKNDFVEIPPNSSKWVHWRSVFDEHDEPKFISWNVKGLPMSFRFKNKKYKIGKINSKYVVAID